MAAIGLQTAHLLTITEAFACAVRAAMSRVMSWLLSRRVQTRVRVGVAALFLSSLAVVFATILALASSSDCIAQNQASTVHYHGVSLAVDQRISAGGDLLKVVLAGEAFLVSEGDAPRQIALRYLTHEKLTAGVTGVDLESIARAAATHNDGEVLVAAVSAGLTRGSAREFDADELWQQLVVHHSPAVWRAIEGGLERAPLGRVCKASAALERASNDHPANTRPAMAPDGAHYRSISDRVARLCVEQAQRDGIEAALTGRDPTELLEQIRSAIELFAPLGSPYRAEGVHFKDLIASLASACEQLDTGRFELSLTALQEVAGRLNVSRETTPVRHRYISRAVERRAYGTAFSALVAIPFEARTPTTHGLVAASLDGLAPSEWGALVEPRIRSMVLQYAAKDEEIAQRWVATQRRLIQELVNTQAVESAERLAQAAYRDDPARAQAALSREVASLVTGYLDRGALESAERVVRELKPTLSVVTRVTIALEQRGVSRVHVLLALLVGVGALGFLLTTRRQRVAQQPSGTSSASNQTQRECPVESAHTEDQRPQPVADTLFSTEYVAALRVFGLEPGATVAQIKNAYRSAVKQYHPDRQRGDYKDDPTLFIRLTAEYEKLLELHEREVAEKRAT